MEIRANFHEAMPVYACAMWFKSQVWMPCGHFVVLYMSVLPYFLVDLFSNFNYRRE